MRNPGHGWLFLEEKFAKGGRSHKKNMKQKLVKLVDKILLRKRSLIETVNDQLKNISQIEHSRHRSIWNFFKGISKFDQINLLRVGRENNFLYTVCRATFYTTFFEQQSCSIVV